MLFDLDGTLVDTAPDLVRTLNHLLAEEGAAPMPYAVARNEVSNGAFGLLKPAALGGALAAAFLLAAVGGFEAGRLGTNSAEAYQALTSEVLLPNPSGGLSEG